jgi:hypothetical protein
MNGSSPAFAAADLPPDKFRRYMIPPDLPLLYDAIKKEKENFY